jgi:hypothetical protein
MPTSVYFNNYGSQTDQRVIEDLIVESMQIMGFDAFYLPIDNPSDRDLLYGEDPVKKFKSAFPLEMYLSGDVMDYQGQQEFFSKFGLEIKDVVTVQVSRRSFSQRVPQNTFTRPREGDLVYVPFLNGTGELYEITFTEQSKDFHMLGRKQSYFYELRLEKFKYSQEIITTGMEDIDSIVEDSGYMIKLVTGAKTSNSNNYTINETVYQAADQTQANATCVAIVQSWTPSANALMVSNISGVFTNNVVIIGASSNARYMLTSYDPQLDNSYNETYDNKYINTQADAIIDFSETNPFGEI